MAVQWERVPERVTLLATEIIEQHHPHLKRARIGLLFRSEAANSQGRSVLGKAATVNGKWRAVLGNLDALDFIIWLAKDWWDTVDTDQKRALIDHELCHCTWNESGRPAMRGHDIEEFNEIIQRYGIWRPGLIGTAEAIQPHLDGLKPEGSVVALKPLKRAGA